MLISQSFSLPDSKPIFFIQHSLVKVILQPIKTLKPTEHVHQTITCIVCLFIDSYSFGIFFYQSFIFWSADQSALLTNQLYWPIRFIVRYFTQSRHASPNPNRLTNYFDEPRLVLCDIFLPIKLVPLLTDHVIGYQTLIFDTFFDQCI